MKKSKFALLDNIRVAAGVFRMRLEGDTSDVAEPGQFVEIELPGLFLRRPISISGLEGNVITLIYKIVGRGTELMSELEPGAELELLTGLGRGFDLTLAGNRPLLIGGGAGAAPLLWLAKALRADGRQVTTAFGWRTADEAFGLETAAAAGADVLAFTEDGSLGARGFATDAADGDWSFAYVCGPTPMLRAADRVLGCGAQFSLEERMGCGFGACMGCSVMTKNGAKRVCKDGPVFDRSELVWQ